LAVTQAVAVQAQRPTRGPAYALALRALPGPCLLDRWRSQQPMLDVEGAVDDYAARPGRCSRSRGAR
jgi:hypothetical protein